jgi:hypothetical protein
VIAVEEKVKATYGPWYSGLRQPGSHRAPSIHSSSAFAAVEVKAILAAAMRYSKVNECARCLGDDWLSD